jgi:predicted dehydrogenase
MINLALIGAGKWGRNYIKTIKRISQCNLKYIKTRNYKDLYKHNDIDGIILATPASTHFKIARDLLNRNYNLLIEKPVTTSLFDADKLKKIADEAGLIVMVGHIYLYNPAYLKAKQLVSKIGKIRYLDFVGMNFGPFRDDISALWDWAPHDLSMCLDIMGKTPRRITAWDVSNVRKRQKTCDMTVIRLLYANGISAFIKVGSLSPVKKRKMTIVGHNGSIIFDDTADKKVEYFNEQQEKSYPHYSFESPLRRQILEFTDCIKKNKKPPTNIGRAMQVIKLIEYAEKSICNNNLSQGLS